MRTVVAESRIFSFIARLRGGDQTVRGLNQINKSQTRLAQSSASAGREFSAQASGLGGLVAAYAGAAATTFALQAAFDKLSQSARQTQTFEGLNTLAASSGQSSSALLNSVREITKNQLTLSEAAQQINLSLSAGFDSSQIEGLSSVAIKASRALGRDLNDAYTRVVRGSAKMETELLDELGIYTKIGPATREYAAAIGKTAAELTEFERRQAFVNNVISEGNKKFGSINTTIPTSAEKIEAFGVTILDIAGSLGRLLADTVAPLADFLSNNLTASFAAFGAIASLVAGKGVTLLKDGLDRLTLSIVASGGAAEQGLRNFLGIGKATQRASTNIAEYSRELVSYTAAEKETFRALQQTAKTRTLHNSELKEANRILTKQKVYVESKNEALREERRRTQALIATEKNRIATLKQAVAQARADEQALVRQGAASTDLSRARGVLGAATRRLNQENARSIPLQQELRASYAANREQILGNVSALRALQNAQASMGKAIGTRGGFAGGISSIYAGVATGIGALGKAFTGLVGKALGLFSIVSMFTLIGTSIAEALGKGQEFDAMMRNISDIFKSLFTDKDAAKLKSVLKGATAGSLEQLEKTNSELRNIQDFTFSTKFIGFEVELTKTKEDLVNEVNNALEKVTKGNENKADITSWGSYIGGTLGGAIGVALGSVVPFLGSSFGLALGATAGSFIGQALQNAFTDTELDLEDVGGQKTLDKLKNTYSEAFTAVGEDLELALAKAFQDIDKEYAAAKFDPVARLAMNTQKQLLADSAKYLNNVETISNLMKSTGETANRISEAFNLSSDGASEVANMLLSIEGKTYELNFSFIDTLDSEIKDFISKEFRLPIELDDESVDVNKLVRNLTAIEGLRLQDSTPSEDFLKKVGLSVKGYEELVDLLNEKVGDKAIEQSAFRNLINPVQDLTQSFGAVNSAVNEFSQATARGSFNAKLLSDEVRKGSIDLETYDQKIKAISTSVYDSVGAQMAAEKALSDYKQETKALAGTEVYEQTVKLLEANVERAKQSAIVNRELLDVLKNQREELQKQADIQSFIEGVRKSASDFNPLDVQLDLFTAGASDEGKLVGQLKFLDSLITPDALAAVDAYDKLKNELQDIGIEGEKLATILGYSSSEADALVNAFSQDVQDISVKNLGDGIVKFKVESENASKTVKLLDDGVKNTALNTKGLSDAMKALIQGAIADLPEYVNKALQDFKKIKKELNEATKIIETFDIPKINIQAQLDRLDYDFEMAKLINENQITRLELDIDITKAKEKLGQLSATQAVKEEARLQNEILSKREELIRKEQELILERGTEQLKLLELENQQNLAAIALEKSQQEQEIMNRVKYVDSLISAYTDFIQNQEKANNNNITNTINAYNNIAKGLYDTLISAGIALNGSIVAAFAKEGPVSGDGPATISAPELSTTDIDFTSTLEDMTVSASNALLALSKNTKALETLENKRFENAKNNLSREVALDYEATEQALANLAKERELQDLNDQAALKGAGGIKDAAEKAKEALLELHEAIAGPIKSAIMGLNDFIVYGEGSIKDVFANMFKSIQQNMFETYIAEPLSTGITDSILGMFGIQSKRGIENAKVESDGALLVRMADPILDMKDGMTDTGGGIFGWFTNLFGKKKQAEDEQKQGATSLFGQGGMLSSMFTNLFGQGGFLANLLGGVFGADGLLASLLKGIGSLFSGGSDGVGIIGSIVTGIFGGGTMAAGGAVQQFASGGGVQKLAAGSMVRDRVPAMLEPGEFVIRKPAARKAGVPALQQLNATGQMGGGAGNIQVNVNNQGSAKSAEVSQPKFDGEKYVIDIVTRDLANNGPIRRSLRGNR